jgi:hypothetical protein
MNYVVSEEKWRAALSLLYEAQNEINTCDMGAKGSYWFGNDVADRIGKFLDGIHASDKKKTASQR